MLNSYSLFYFFFNKLSIHNMYFRILQTLCNCINLLSSSSIVTTFFFFLHLDMHKLEVLFCLENFFNFFFSVSSSRIPKFLLINIQAFFFTYKKFYLFLAFLLLYETRLLQHSRYFRYSKHHFFDIVLFLAFHYFVLILLAEFHFPLAN